eukprot:jgi/Galph1/3685/GphlegSOOS_G2357.1
MTGKAEPPADQRNIEVERKFLVLSQAYRHKATISYGIRQGYLSATNEHSVRIRMMGNNAFLTIKGHTVGCVRKEFEYKIPVEDARDMLNTICLPPQIEKTRYIVEETGFTWEVDEFHGDNAGLIVAEVELTDESVQVPVPEWVGREITYDSRFLNSVLIRRPFSTWSEAERSQVQTHSPMKTSET